MNIGTILTGISDAIGALPLIQNIILGVEGLFGSGNGPQKLAAATSAATSALQIYGQAAGKTLPATVQDDIQAAINANVKVMNDLGLLLPQTTSNTTAPA